MIVVVAVQLFPSVAEMVYVCALNPVKVPAGDCVAEGLMDIVIGFIPDAETVRLPLDNPQQETGLMLGDEKVVCGACVKLTTEVAVQLPASETVKVYCDCVNPGNTPVLLETPPGFKV